MTWTVEHFDDLSAVWLFYKLPGKAFACIEYHPDYPDFLDYTVDIFNGDTDRWDGQRAKTVESAKKLGEKMIKQWKAERRKEYK